MRKLKSAKCYICGRKIGRHEDRRMDQVAIDGQRNPIYRPAHNDCKKGGSK